MVSDMSKARNREVEAFLAWARDEGVGATWLFNRSAAKVLADRVDKLEATLGGVTDHRDALIDVVRELRARVEALTQGQQRLIEAADWYQHCLEAVILRRPVRGLDEAEAAYESAKAAVVVPVEKQPPAGGVST